MTLLEVILALALTVLVAGLVGGLTQWYVDHRTRSDQRFAQLRMARTLLSMIADDLRCVVRNEPLDLEPLKQLLANGAAGGAAAAMGSAGGGSGGGGAAGGDALGGGDISGGAGSAGGSAAGGSGLGSMGSVSGSSAMGTSATGDLLGGETLAAGSLPPGIYATETAMEIDVSLVPRPDQSIVLTPDLMGGTLTDLPTDIKTVSYYIQPAGPSGVQDPLAALTSQATGGAAATGGGLVRRSLARAVVQKSYTDGTTDQLMRTGDLIAPEAVGLAFEFYDGAQWLTVWDASAQGLPLVVRVTIALQDPGMPLEQRLTPPIPLQTAAADSLAASGVRLYSTLVPIAGAAIAGGQPSSAADATAGMGAMGL